MTSIRVSAGTVFLVLAAPFFLNDFVFWAFGSGYGVYLSDYATRILVLAVMLFWVQARSVISARPRPMGISIWPLIAIVMALIVIGEPVFDRIDNGVDEWTGIGKLFRFSSIDGPFLYWLDLSLGLFLVALTEELVFRKAARRWFHDIGAGPIITIIASALIFGLMHWGGGAGQVVAATGAGAVYMALYLKMNHLWPLVLAHWGHNFLAFGPYKLL